MYINRRTVKIKPGATGEVVKLVKAEIERSGSTVKIYTPTFGPFDVAVIDFEFESLEAYEKMWDEWFASPEGAQFMEKWVPLVEAGGTNELWEVA